MARITRLLGCRLLLSSAKRLPCNRFEPSLGRNLPASVAQLQWSAATNAHSLHTAAGYCLAPAPSDKLSPQEANLILRHNEHSVEIGISCSSSRNVATTEVPPPPLYSISSVDSNLLAANAPIEDKMTSARCLHTTAVAMSDVVLRLRGLPWSTTEEEIVSFFDPIELAGGVDGVHITMSQEGRPSGKAYVELADVDDISEAEKKHNQHIGHRYVEVFRAQKSEMESVIKRSKNGDNEDDCCVRLRGLPFGCSKEEIVQFFEGFEIVPNGIALVTDYQGRHTGEAYVQFADKETAERSQEKHKEKIAHRYIEIFKSNRGGGFNNRPSPYDSRDRYGGPNRYMGGGGSSRGR